MNKEELKEQLQQDLISILEGFGIDDAMDHSDYKKMVFLFCDSVLTNVNKLK